MFASLSGYFVNRQRIILLNFWGLHFVPTMEVLNAGKHVLVEKPLSLDIREAEQMVAKAEEKGVQLAIDYNRRYARPYLKAKEYVDNGDIGKLAYVMMKLSQGGPASSAKGPYYLLFELQTHAIERFTS